MKRGVTKKQGSLFLSVLSEAAADESVFVGAGRSEMARPGQHKFSHKVFDSNSLPWMARPDHPCLDSRVQGK